MPYTDATAQRTYQAQWRARRRAEWFSENGPCVDCKSWDALELDHWDASTKISHRVWTWSSARRDAELAKCEVRCAPCHKLKTVEMMEKPRGQAVGSSKLNPEAVVRIRFLRDSGETFRSIASAYGVSERNVRFICLGVTWRSV